MSLQLKVEDLDARAFVEALKLDRLQGKTALRLRHGGTVGTCGIRTCVHVPSSCLETSLPTPCCDSLFDDMQSLSCTQHGPGPLQPRKLRGANSPRTWAAVPRPLTCAPCVWTLCKAPLGLSHWLRSH